MSRQVSRIFLNDNIVSHTSGRGVTRYFRKIADGVIAQFGSNVLICSPELRDYGAAKHIRSLRFRGSYRLKLHDRWASLLSYIERPLMFYSSYYGNAWTKTSEVFTVYDMIDELLLQDSPSNRHSSRKFIVEKRRCIERAAALLAISQSTAKDIVACYPHVDATKIVVTYLGVDDFFFENDDRESGNQVKPYFLYVGHRTIYKNFLRLLSAFGQSGLARDFDLRVISPGSLSPQELEYIDRYRLQGSIHVVPRASEATLRASYTRAVAFVYPSEYEGFGLPILEAMASGTIVATSNRSSMPEVGGDVAFYFDPRDVDSMIHCLQQVASLPAQQRREHITLGIAWAKTFTWSRCQQQTLDVFQRFL